MSGFVADAINHIDIFLGGGGGEALVESHPHLEVSLKIKRYLQLFRDMAK